MTIGEKLREIRHKKKWNVEKLSKKSGIHYNQIWQYENGSKHPGFKNILILAKALKVSLRQFDKCDVGEIPETPGETEHGPECEPERTT